MRRALTLVGFGATLAACGLFFDFDAYQTTSAHAPSGASDAAVDDADFELVVADTIRIDPGGDAPLEVSVKRTGGPAQRIVVSLGSPPPPSIDGNAKAQIEAGETTTTLAIHAFAEMPSTPLHVVATAGQRVRQRDVTAVARGASCTLDRGFGTAQNGVVRIFTGGAENDATAFGVALLTDGEIALGNKGAGSASLHLFHRDGLPDIDGQVRDPSGVAVDPERLVVTPRDELLVVSRGEIRHYTRATLQAEDVPVNTVADPDCVPEVASDGNALAICGPGTTNAWILSVSDSTGQPLPGGRNQFGPTDLGTVTSAFMSAGRVVGCGFVSRLDASYAALAAWDPDGGQHDPAFGSGGIELLEARTTFAACSAVDGGIVGLGDADKTASVFGLTVDGGVDRTFGDGGIAPVPSDGDIAAKRFILADDDGFLVVQTMTMVHSVFRFLRNGSLDRSFAQAGRCDLFPFALGEVDAVALAPGRRLMIASHDAAGSTVFLSRLWL